MTKKAKTDPLLAVVEIQMDSDADFIANFCSEGEWIKYNGEVIRHTTCRVDTEAFINFMHQREALIIQALSK